jgi:hypothetical protein
LHIQTLGMAPVTIRVEPVIKKESRHVGKGKDTPLKPADLRGALLVAIV